MNKRIPDIRPGIRFLEIYQVTGGAIGIALTLWILKNQQSFNSLIVIIYLFAFVLYGYSIYCGLLLIRNVKKGLAHSRINQVLQAINFAVSGYSFQYVSGLYVYAGIDLTNFRNAFQFWPFLLADLGKQ